MHSRYGASPSPNVARASVGRARSLFDPEAGHHLRRGGDAEAVDHQAPLAPGVEGEAAALREQGVEERKVQGRLLVGRRMEDGPILHQGQAADGRVVEIGIEGDDVGVAGLHRAQQGRGLGALQVDPALLVLLPCPGGIGQQRPGEGMEALTPPRLRGDPVHGHPVEGLGPWGQFVAPGQAHPGRRW